MSQKCVELLLGRILTDEDFRRDFFPRMPHEVPNFELAASHGLSLTPVERTALSRLERKRVDLFARTLDPRISRSSISAAVDPAPVAAPDESPEA
jgi:hypothetical protein